MKLGFFILLVLGSAPVSFSACAPAQILEIARPSVTTLDTLRPYIEQAKLRYRSQGAFKSQGMSGDGNERFGHEMHLSNSERLKYRVDIINGVVYDADGRLYDTSGGRAWTDPRESTAILVMDGHGDFYSSTYRQLNKFHHSTLLNGGEAAAAGEWIVIDGIILDFRDRSGHYPQSRDFSSQALASMEMSGVDLTEMGLSFHF